MSPTDLIRLAIHEAHAALTLDEVPIGCVIYHIPTDRKLEVGAFPAPPAYAGEWRCDTHPSASRSGRQFCFDSAHAGGRQVYLADIGGLLD